MHDTQTTLRLTESVNKVLVQSELPAALTIEECASLLAMSMTSFRRKLAQEETSFKLIQNKFLNELCIDALLTEHTHIDSLAIKLGYSERATFERAFRKKFGVTPSQFKKLSQIGETNRSYLKLTEIAKNIPPMPGSCRQLLEEKEQGNLDLHRVLDIVSQDAIFSARIMGLASKAIYGKTPKNLKEAISRNLGVNSIINFAIVFAVKDALQDHVEQTIIDQYSTAFLMAPKLFQCIRKSLGSSIKFDVALTEQVLVFSLIGVFLLSHKNAYKHELMLYSLRGIKDLSLLNNHIRKSMGISIYSSSSLMLSLWHIDVSLIKQLNHIEKISKSGTKSDTQDQLVFFMLSCLYSFAAGLEEFTELEQRAELLGIQNFEEIRCLLFQ